MRTYEKPTLRMRTHDEAIFVASDNRRARRLRRAAAVTAFLGLLWVVGLGIGMLGFGHIPDVPFVKAAHAESPAAVTPAVPATRAPGTARALAAAAAARAALRSAATQRRAQATAAATRRAATTKVTRAAAAAATPPAAAVNPAQRTRGWARKGNAVPPGQARRALRPPAPPPPATSKGRRVGQTVTTPQPVVAPGQAKKALDPPPPPPPPKKG
jgi:hypothetical protein